MSRKSDIPAKLLLFGEYTVLSGGRALAMPSMKWSGRLVNAETTDRSLVLDEWAEYVGDKRIMPDDALAAFREDIATGLHFASNIPVGYGLGSSGALCAAVHQKYMKRPKELSELRIQLSELESFFHGKSSGMDPLVSYLSRPLLREGSHYHLTAQIFTGNPVEPMAFLIDSGVPRETGTLVGRFMQAMREPDFRQVVLYPLTEASDHAIGFLLEKHWSMFWQFVEIISRLQFERMPEFIPSSVMEIWENVMLGDNIRIKLCGAGGGGVFLGLARDPAAYEAARSLPGFLSID